MRSVKVLIGIVGVVAALASYLIQVGQSGWFPAWPLAAALWAGAYTLEQLY